MFFDVFNDYFLGRISNFLGRISKWGRGGEIFWNISKIYTPGTFLIFPQVWPLLGHFFTSYKSLFYMKLFVMDLILRLCMLACENLIWMIIHRLNLYDLGWFLHIFSKTFVNNWPMLDHVRTNYHFVSNRFFSVIVHHHDMCVEEKKIWIKYS